VGAQKPAIELAWHDAIARTAVEDRLLLLLRVPNPGAGLEQGSFT
jgi:hypothetical protein